MKNSLIRRFISKEKLKIKGNNIERFIRRIIQNKIEIISLERIKYNEIDIIIYKKDLNDIEKLKTIYDLKIIRSYGIAKIKNLFIKNKYIIIFIILCLILIYTLSNMIFSIDIVHNKKEIRTLLKEELKLYGIDKYKFKKNYKEREKIKEKILNKYKDKLEWIEIEEYGTKYIIKVEERIINKEEKIKNIQDVIAKKNGIIISVEAKNGEILKNTNDYVHKGETIISGNIYLNEELKEQTSALGKVYAETWYISNIKYPYHYKKIKLTNKKKVIFTIKLFNKYYDLFNFKKYKTKKVKNNVIIKNNYIPISFIKQKQYETNEIDKIYNKNEVLYHAIEEGKKRILNSLDKDSEVLDYRILNKNYTKEGIELKIFYSVKENITDYKKIEEIKEKQN